MAEVTQVAVPDIGDFDEVPVIEILVSPGDTISPEDPLVPLESDKATMDVPAPVAGVVQEVLVSVGDKVTEGTALLTVSSGLPCSTRSPIATSSSLTTPATGDGTSIVALSDSSVISGSSSATVSPGETMTSMIGTSAKSPMSGTRTSSGSATEAGLLRAARGAGR